MAAHARPGRAPGRSGSGPIPATVAAFFRRALQRADGRPAEVAEVGGAGEPQPDDAAGEGTAVLVLLLRRRAPCAPADPRQAGPGEPPHAIHAEMHAQPDVVVEQQEHLLAPRLGAEQPASVQHRRALGEPPLRTAGAERVADEVRRESFGEAVNGMAFGHVAVLIGDRGTWGRPIRWTGSASPWTVLARPLAREAAPSEPAEQPAASATCSTVSGRAQHDGRSSTGCDILPDGQPSTLPASYSQKRRSAFSRAT